ncbi:MAG: alpha-L-fucosidase [Verrucomicrobia bacterium]|nr:alpha-L-fucosidase [Verrucomicrobiota bacterium]
MAQDGRVASASHSRRMNNSRFTETRYGLFIHYGLYSLLERGEWVWNREAIPREEYKALAGRFTAKNFDADRRGRPR